MASPSQTIRAASPCPTSIKCTTKFASSGIAAEENSSTGSDEDSEVSEEGSIDSDEGSPGRSDEDSSGKEVSSVSVKTLSSVETETSDEPCSSDEETSSEIGEDSLICDMLSTTDESPPVVFESHPKEASSDTLTNMRSTFLILDLIKYHFPDDTSYKANNRHLWPPVHYHTLLYENLSSVR